MKGSGYIRKRGNIYWIAYYACGRRISESTGSSERGAAERLLKQRIGEMAAGTDVIPEKATLADLCELVFADYRLRDVKGLKIEEWRYQSNIKPALGSIKAARFGSNQIRAYIASRREHGASLRPLQVCAGRAVNQLGAARK